MSVSGCIYKGNTHKTPEYVRKMDLDVANIDKNDKNTCMDIYKAIDVRYFGGVKLFPKSFLNQCKKYLNETQKNPADIRKNIKIFIRRKFICEGGYDLSYNNGSEAKTRKTRQIKYSFQGKSAISNHWFGLDIECTDKNLSTREPQFHKRLFQRNIEGQAGSKYPIFPVPIGNVKKTSEVEYKPKAPLIEYCENISNNSCFISLPSVLTGAGENKSARAVAMGIE